MDTRVTYTFYMSSEIVINTLTTHSEEPAIIVVIVTVGSEGFNTFPADSEEPLYQGVCDVR